MNEHSKNSAQKIIETLDLPQDIFLGLPNLSLNGNRELYISNHKGIMYYGQEKIVILAMEYQIQVIGKELNIVSYTREDLTIQGYILSVEFL